MRLRRFLMTEPTGPPSIASWLTGMSASHARHIRQPGTCQRHSVPPQVRQRWAR
jgi:hypothetical protein